MIFNLNNPFDVEKFERVVSRCKEKKDTVELLRKREVRTISQNSYLHLILSWFAIEYGISRDEAKLDFFKRGVNKDIFEQTHKNKKGNDVVYLLSTNSIDTKTMTIAIERFRNWASSEAGIYIPSPNEEQFLIHIQQEIQNNRTFL